jgi:hypothetical protein
MAYDHGNYDYSHGLLPKIHFRENRYNTPNSGAMKPIDHPKDRHGYDRSQFSPKRRMHPYGDGAKSYWSHDRKQNTSTPMRKHYCSERKTSRRFRLKQEMMEILNDTINYRN